MTVAGRDYAWLPDHQLHAALTLAHADALIARAGELLYDYVKPPGALHLSNVAHGEQARLVVVAVAPLPAALPRYAADALTQLRAALEHTLYAEVEHQLGRKLGDKEARRVEMPATSTAEAFTDWLRAQKRPDPPPLRHGSPLVQRIRDLQPYQRRRPDDHPLRVLAEHTNLTKHRTPAVAATVLGAVLPDALAADLRVAAARARPAPDRPIEPGDVLHTGPLHEQVSLSIWPKVSVQRPHSGTWQVLMKELGDLEEWVRTVAVPHLVTGRHDVDPLPPQLDTTIGHDDVRAALATAGTAPAGKRLTRRIEAGTVRQDLVETLALHSSRPDPRMLHAWLDALDDDQVLAAHDRLAGPASSRDHTGVEAVAVELLAEATQAVRSRRDAR